MIHGLVLTHGGIGEELVKVVRMILGPVEGLQSASNLGCSARQISELVSGWLSGLDAESQGLIFIDEMGGSCASAARLAETDRVGVPILSGVNLAMLLTFITWRDELPTDELVQRVVDHGRQAVALIGFE
jgi:mannose/fructose-specific phosphotransferase system component IIA